MSDVPKTSNKNGQEEGKITVCYIAAEPYEIGKVESGKVSRVEEAAEDGGITVKVEPTKCTFNPDGKSYNRDTKNGKSTIKVDPKKVREYLNMKMLYDGKEER